MDRGEYPDLDEKAALSELKRLAALVKAARAEDPTLLPAEALSGVLARGAGFGGAVDDYDDPENSYLTRVLVRRRGLPILLSIIWIEVARLAGIPAFGLPYPGHFLVFVGARRDGQYVDPFRGGRVLSEHEALDLWLGAGPGADLPSPITRASPRRILLRVLANLVQSYERRRDATRLDRVITDQLVLSPHDPVLVARRGLARAGGGNRAGALQDLNWAVGFLPPGRHFDRAHDVARRLVRARPSLN